jgi:hypothetical protein
MRRVVRRVVLLLAVLGPARPSTAHPVPFSCLDVRLFAGENLPLLDTNNGVEIGSPL